MDKTCSTAELAEITGMGTEALGHLRRKGVIETIAHGTWNLADTIQKLLDMGSGDVKEKIEKQRLFNLERDGEKKSIEVEKMRGDLVALDVVKEDANILTAAMKAGLRRLESSMPPQLEGLNAAAIQRKLAEACDELLNDFSDGTSALYNPVEIKAEKPKAEPKKSSAKKSARKVAGKRR